MVGAKIAEVAEALFMALVSIAKVRIAQIIGETSITVWLPNSTSDVLGDKVRGKKKSGRTTLSNMIIYQAVTYCPNMGQHLLPWVQKSPQHSLETLEWIAQY